MRLCLSALLLCAAFRCASAQHSTDAAQTGTASESAVPEAKATSTISVSARLVVVPVTVRDKKGALVRTLTKDDFTLSEDGKAQTIRYFDHENNAPLTLGRLVDVSGSQRTVLDDERTASSAFLDTLLQPDRDKAFIVEFGHEADLLADVTGSLPKLQAGLKKIDGDEGGRPQFSNGGSGSSTDPQDNGSGGGSGWTSGGSGNNQGSGNSGSGSGRGGRRGGYGGAGTVMYDAIYLASDEVIGKQQNRKALILLTDGDDRGSKESIGSAIEAAQRADTAVYAIYYKGESPRYDNGGGGHRGGMGGGFPGGRGGFPGGFPGGGGGQGGGGGRSGESRVDGKKILERIADETGGRVFTVSKKEPLDDIYKQIAEELRSQYRLGFSPTDHSDGYHKLLVDLPKDKKSFIQAREGYYTGTAR